MKRFAVTPIPKFKLRFYSTHKYLKYESPEEIQQPLELHLLLPHPTNNKYTLVAMSNTFTPLYLPLLFHHHRSMAMEQSY